MAKAKYFTLLAALWLSATSVSAAVYRPEMDKGQEVYDQLRVVLAELDLKNFVQINFGLGVYFNTQVFQVHDIDESGYISPESVEVQGPKHDGFVIRANMGPRELTPYLEVPQTVDEVYWSTYVNCYPLAEGEVYLHLSLSFGRNTDPELIQQIQETFSSVYSADSEQMERAGE